MDTWNSKLGEIWQLLTQDPSTFRGGGIWDVMVNIHGALQAIGYGLLVLFFAIGVVRTCGSFAEARRPETALKLFIRFILAKAAVSQGLELMLALFSIVQGMVGNHYFSGGCHWCQRHNLASGNRGEDRGGGFLGVHPLVGGDPHRRAGHHSAVFRNDPSPFTPGCLSFICTPPSLPSPCPPFAGETTSHVGKNFLRSYAGVCLEGAIIALACIIFSVMAASPPAVDPDVSAVTAVWSYIGELVFNLLELVGAVKMSDRIVKEIMGIIKE